VATALVWLAAVVHGAVGAGPADAARVWPKPVQYRAWVRWDARTSTLAGSERIAFVNDGPRALSDVWLRLWPNGYGSCSRPLARVSVAGYEPQKAARYGARTGMDPGRAPPPGAEGRA